MLLVGVRSDDDKRGEVYLSEAVKLEMTILEAVWHFDCSNSRAPQPAPHGRNKIYGRVSIIQRGLCVEDLSLGEAQLKTTIKEASRPRGWRQGLFRSLKKGCPGRLFRDNVGEVILLVHQRNYLSFVCD